MQQGVTDQQPECRDRRARQQQPGPEPQSRPAMRSAVGLTWPLPPASGRGPDTKARGDTVMRQVGGHPAQFAARGGGESRGEPVPELLQREPARREMFAQPGGGRIPVSIAHTHVALTRHVILRSA